MFMATPPIAEIESETKQWADTAKSLKSTVKEKGSKFMFQSF